MRASTTPVLGEDGVEVNGSVEAKPTIGQDIDPMALIITRRVYNRDLKHESARR